MAVTSTAMTATTRVGLRMLVRTGDLVIDLDAKSVEVGGAPVRLKLKEYQVLEFLSLPKGATLTKEMFLSHLYGEVDQPEDKIIDIVMERLRKKLAQASGGSNYIKSVDDNGFRLDEPIESTSGL